MHLFRDKYWITICCFCGFEKNMHTILCQFKCCVYLEVAHHSECICTSTATATECTVTVWILNLHPTLPDAIYVFYLPSWKSFRLLAAPLSRASPLHLEADAAHTLLNVDVWNPSTTFNHPNLSSQEVKVFKGSRRRCNRPPCSVWMFSCIYCPVIMHSQTWRR